MRFLSRAIIGFILLLVTIAILVGGYASYKSIMAGAPEPFKRKARERVWQVETMRATPTDVPISISAFGTVAAGRTLNIKSEIGGKVVQISPNLQTGKIVNKGELLFSIDTFRGDQDAADAKLALSNNLQQIEELQLQISNERESQMERQDELLIAKEDLERQLKLNKRGFVSSAAVDRAQTAVNAAQRLISGSDRSIALLEAKVEQLDIAKQRTLVGVESANRNLTATEFRAPFKGLIANANLEQGRQVTTNDNLATLIDMNALEVAFRISDRDLGQMLDAETSSSAGINGKKVDVFWQLGAKKLIFSGQISRIGANVDASLGGLEVFAQLNNISTDTALRPGAYVEVSLDAGQEKQVYALPQSAVSPSGQLFYVNDEKRIELTKVQVIRREGDLVLVRGNVPQDKELIKRRFPQISKGVKVKFAKTPKPTTDGEKVNTASTELPTTITLTDATKQLLLKRFENIPIPANRKKKIIANIGSDEMSRASLERMADRMQLDLPELKAPATPEPPVTKVPDGQIVLSKETQDQLLKRINAAPIPNERKKKILADINSGQMKRKSLERMADRMGLDLPELAN